MRCNVTSVTAEQAWVIVPHVGCAHQYSKCVLSVFADREVALDGELQVRVRVGSPSPYPSP